MRFQKESLTDIAMKKSFIILIMLLSGWNLTFGQKIKNASGEALSRLEEHMSKDELKEKLREQAIIRAIENTYGSTVTQKTEIQIQDGHTRFNIDGATLVRGEWLKTVEEKYSEEFREVKTRDGKRMEVWVNCKIKGKVREITSSPVVIDFSTGNCPDKKCDTSVFKDGESMYLFFKTPVDGYLSVFAVEDEQAFRLLPYQQMSSVYAHAVPVKGNKDYVFFSNYRSHDYFPGFSFYKADQLLMLTDKQEEDLKLYVVFSTESFHAALLDEENETEEGEGIPKSLSYDSFTNWLENNRMFTTGFDYKMASLKIIK